MLAKIRRRQRLRVARVTAALLDEGRPMLSERSLKNAFIDMAYMSAQNKPLIAIRPTKIFIPVDNVKSLSDDSVARGEIPGEV